jgi:hypothetical protein
MTLRLRHATVAIAVVGALAGLAGIADAASKRSRTASDGYQWVTAVSAYHGPNTSISAPTRPSRWGREVRLPGGSWIDCAGDCREKLRETTIDFWIEQQNRGGRDCSRC